MSELADETDSKSVVRKGVWVRVPPPAPYFNITINAMKSPGSTRIFLIFKFAFGFNSKIATPRAKSSRLIFYYFIFMYYDKS